MPTLQTLIRQMAMQDAWDKAARQAIGTGARFLYIPR